MVEPPNPPYIPARWQGGSQGTINRIVLHGTVSPTEPGGARNVAHYFQTTDRVSSAHYVRDPFETIQCVYDHTVAWHDGTNYNSIGYEFCDWVAYDRGRGAPLPIERWFDAPHMHMLKGAAEDIRKLCLAYNVPIRWITPTQIRKGWKGICTHRDMRDAFPGSTSHWDPGTFPHEMFLNMIRDPYIGERMSKENVLAGIREFWNTRWHDPVEPGDQADVSYADMTKKVYDALARPWKSKVKGSKYKAPLSEYVLQIDARSYEDHFRLLELEKKVDAIHELLAQAVNPTEGETNAGS